MYCNSSTQGLFGILAACFKSHSESLMHLLGSQEKLLFSLFQKRHVLQGISTPLILIVAMSSPNLIYHL